MKTSTVWMMALLFVWGCGADDSWSSGASNKDEEYPGGPSADVAAGDAAMFMDVPQAEQELDFDFKAPQASQNYVYIAATARDSLVRIDARTLDIRLIPVGGRPTRVATLPGTDVALVINSGTSDVSVVTSTATSDTVKTVDVVPHVNRIAVAPSGRYAIVYYDRLAAEPTDPVGDFQTLSLLDIQGDIPKSVRISVGFKPSSVVFHETLLIAYIVTDDGVSILNLDQAKEGTITPVVPLSDDAMEDPSLREVLIPPTGSYALVRSLSRADLTVVDLTSGKLSRAALNGIPTDVDLIPHQNKALLVLREQALAYVVDLEGLLAEDPESLKAISIQGTGAGAAVVSPTGERAVLYTTTGTVKSVAVMDLAGKDHSWEVFPVQKNVKGVDLSTSGSRALVLHEREGASPGASGVDQTIAQSHGFSLFDLDSGFRKLIVTENRWSTHLFVGRQGAEDRLFVLTPDPKEINHFVQVVDLVTFIAEPVRLSSQPTSMVHVPVSGQVAVAQEHDNGRISFVDVVTGQVYSVTGYELNGLIQ
jgi:hypothetical protein